MSKAILCAIDLEHVSIGKAILREAQKLAEIDGAVLNVVTVVPDYGTSFVGSFFEKGTLKKAVEATNDQLHKFVKDNTKSGTKVRHIVSIGSIYEEVLAAADKTNADLVVLGASKPDIKDFLLGPNASRVARHAKVSVYIVRLPG